MIVRSSLVPSLIDRLIPLGRNTVALTMKRSLGDTGSANTTFDLPVLDMATYHDDRSAFVESFRSACTRVGFFYLRHQIPKHVVQEMFRETKVFFEDCSLVDKQRISYEHYPSLRGYMALGVENTAGRVDYREQVEYAVEYPLDFYPNNNDNDRNRPLYERLRARRNPWPDDFLPSLEPVTRAYTRHLQSITDALRQTYSLTLGMSANALDEMFAADDPRHPPHWVIKLLSYPAVPSTSSATAITDNESWGVGPHVDTNFFTLILTDRPGLQAWVQGEWREVPPQPSSNQDNHAFASSEASPPAFLIVNLGEQAQALSHGTLRATPHRVLPHRGIGCRRTSLAFFANPSLQTRMETRTALKQNATSHWKEDRPNRILGTVGDNTFKSLARSHPHVFQKHHPDVQALSDGSLVVNEDRSQGESGMT